MNLKPCLKYCKLYWTALSAVWCYDATPIYSYLRGEEPDGGLENGLEPLGGDAVAKAAAQALGQHAAEPLVERVGVRGGGGGAGGA